MELSAYPTDKMNDMTVILCFFIEINFYIVAVPAQVIAGKIDQHDVFGVFFRVVFQVVCILCIRIGVAGAFCRACNRVDISAAALYAAMCFG